MLITLIRPAHVLPANSHQAQQGTPPLGLAYLAGALLRAEFECNCIDATGENLQHYYHIRENFLGQGLTNAEVVERIPAHSRVIGVSCMFAPEWFHTRELVQLIRRKFPDAVIVLGGEHATGDSRYLLTSTPEINYILHGEGEEAIVEFCERVKKNESPENLAGLSFLNSEGKYVFTGARPRRSDIDGIAAPAWHLVPLEKYLALGYGNNIIGERSVPMLASRGCPYRCAFCTSPQMWTRKWLARNPDGVIAEIRAQIKTFGATHIEFYDLTTIIDRRWILEFCRKLLAANTGVRWSLPSGTRSEVLDLEVLRALKASGCNKITLAPESGSEETLRQIHKKVNLANMLRVIRDASATGLIVKLNIIYGFPGQGFRSVFETMLFLMRAAWCGAHDAACFAFVPYPGTELFNQLVAEGKITIGEDYPLWLGKLVNTKISGIKSWSERISDRWLNFLIPFSMALFYAVSFVRRPQRFFTLLKRIFTGKPLTMLEMLLFGIYRNFILGLKLKALRQP